MEQISKVNIVMVQKYSCQRVIRGASKQYNWWVFCFGDQWWRRLLAGGSTIEYCKKLFALYYPELQNSNVVRSELYLSCGVGSGSFRKMWNAVL